MKRIKIFLLLTVLAGFFSACIPQTQGSAYQVAVINAPTEARVVGLAERLEAGLIQHGYNGFTSSTRLRFIERSREMHGYRAILSSAQIARTVGAEYAVFVGAPTYERQIEEITPIGSLIKVLHISTKLQLEAVIVDPVTAKELVRFSSHTYIGERIVPLDSKVPNKEDDPNIKQAINNALADISPALAMELESLLVNYQYPNPNQ